MRKLFIILIIFLHQEIVNAKSNADTSILIQASWQIGDSHHYRLTLNREKTEDGKISKFTSYYDIVLKVTAIQDSNYIIEWKYRNIKSQESGKNPLADKLAKITEDVPIRYTTDRKGRFLQLINWMEIRDQIFKAADKITNDRPDKETEKTMTYLKGIYSSQKNIETLALADIRIFHAMYGYTFSAGRKDIYSSQLPNIYGGTPFFAQTMQTLVSINPALQTAEVKSQTTIDRKKSLNIITELTDQLQKQQKGSVQKDIRINIEDEATYIFHQESGWVKEAQFKRLIDTNELQNKDTYLLKEMNSPTHLKKQ
ncbi:MAG: hypothetical protein ACK445_06870 [Bacteroidota bacterium]|jgi:hypothetical protein